MWISFNNRRWIEVIALLQRSYLDWIFEHCGGDEIETEELNQRERKREGVIDGDPAAK